MTIGELIERVRTYQPAAALDVIQKAYDFSAEVHKGQRRASGEPYLTHPVQVAGIIADMRLDVPSVVTGLLHDTVEDTLATPEQIEREFGGEIASLVDGVSTIGGGSAPGSTLPTRLVQLTHSTLNATSLEQRLRTLDPPVIARIENDRVVLDLRTVPAEDDERLATLLLAASGAA